jgi:hypothetical protein
MALPSVLVAENFADAEISGGTTTSRGPQGHRKPPHTLQAIIGEQTVEQTLFEAPEGGPLYPPHRSSCGLRQPFL